MIGCGMSTVGHFSAAACDMAETMEFKELAEDVLES